MRWILLSLSFAVCAPQPALADKAPSTNVVLVPSSSMLSGVALNASAGTRTATITIAKSWAKLRFGIQFTRSAATSVTSQFTCSYDGTTYYRRTTKACSSGTCTLYEQSDDNPQSTSVNFEIEYDVRGCQKVQILLGGASAGASDLVTTQAVAIVGE